MKHVPMIAAILVISMFSGTLWADYTVGNWHVKQLTNNDYNDQDPQISGSNVTWVAQVDWSDWEIMYFDGTTQDTRQLTDNGTSDLAPRISGSNVVWQASVLGHSQIFFYDGVTGDTTQITTNFVGDYAPDVSGTDIVWEGFHGTDRDIFFYDSSADSIIQLTDNTYGDQSARISEGTAVWEGRDTGGAKQIMFYNGSDIIQLSSGGNPWFPEMAGTYPGPGFSVVWQGYDGSDWEIYMYDGDTTTQVTNNALLDGPPQTDGSSVVWTATVGEWPNFEGEVFLYNGSDTMILPNPEWKKSVHSPQVSGSFVVWWANSDVFGYYDGEIMVYDGYSTTQLTDNTGDDVDVQISGTNIVWEGYDGYDYEIFMATYIDNTPGMEMSSLESGICHLEWTPAGSYYLEYDSSPTFLAPLDSVEIGDTITEYDYDVGTATKGFFRLVPR